MNLGERIEEISYRAVGALHNGKKKLLRAVRSRRNQTRALALATIVGAGALATNAAIKHQSSPTHHTADITSHTDKAKPAASTKAKAKPQPAGSSEAPKLPEKLIPKYSSESLRFAEHVISNGKRIYAHPHKEQELEKSRLEVSESIGHTKPLRLFGYCDEDREKDQIAAIYDARDKLLDLPSKYSLYLPVEFIVAALSAEG